MDGSFIRKIKKMFQIATRPDDTTVVIEKFDEALTPNMRAIRLAMSIADTLIAMGVAVSDVVSIALDVTDRYCKRKVQFDISSSLITASQDRGDSSEPLTMIRHAQPRTVNYMTVQKIQELARGIEHGKINLDDAEARFDVIVNNPNKYPRWVAVAGSGILSAGVGAMLGAKPSIIAIMFVLAVLVTYLLRYLAHIRVPMFFGQVFAALLITLTAALVAYLDRIDVFPWLNDVNPTLIVIGGIVLLVAGLAIVGAVQDAIDEFYVTANARLLRVVMMTIGIVAGVLIGMYIARQLGVSITIDGDTVGQGGSLIIGSFLAAVGYALSMQSHPISVIVAGGMGALAIVVYSLIVVDSPLSFVVASGVAATAVGMTATLVSRVWHTPSVALITAGIIPLVPGLALYNGLFDLIAGTAASFDQGVETLLNAALIALAIASGASLGHLAARPIRRTLVRARNSLPRRKLSS